MPKSEVTTGSHQAPATTKGTFDEVLHSQIMGDILLPSMDTKALMHLGASSKFYYFAAINELFRRHNVESKQAQINLLDSWQRRSYEVAAKVREENIRRQYQANTGDFTFQAKLILYALNTAPSLGCELAKELILMSSAAEGTLHLYTVQQQLAYFPALLKVIDELHTKQISLDKKTLEHIKILLVHADHTSTGGIYDVQIPEKNILMRYLCFCHGVEIVTHSKILDTLWEVDRNAYEQSRAHRMKGASLFKDETELVASLSGQKQWQWLKQELGLHIDEVLTFSGHGLSWGLYDTPKIIAKNIPQDILQTLFVSKEDLLGSFYKLFEAKNSGSFYYLSFVIDLLPKLDKALSKEVAAEIVSFLKQEDYYYPTSVKLHFLARLYLIQSKQKALSMDSLSKEISELLQKDYEKWAPIFVLALLPDELVPERRIPKEDMPAFLQSVENAPSFKVGVDVYKLVMEAASLAEIASSLEVKQIEKVANELADILSNVMCFGESLPGFWSYQLINAHIGGYFDPLHLGHRAYELFNYLPADKKRGLIQRFVEQYETEYQIKYTPTDDEDKAYRMRLAQDIIESLAKSLSFSEMQRFEPEMRWKIYSIVASSDFIERGFETPRHFIDFIYEQENAPFAFPLDIRDVVLSEQDLQWFGHEEAYKDELYPKDVSCTPEELEELKVFLDDADNCWRSKLKGSKKFQKAAFTIASHDDLYHRFCINYRDKLLDECKVGGRIYSAISEGESSIPVEEFHGVSMIESTRAIYLSQQALLQQDHRQKGSQISLGQSRDTLFSTSEAEAKLETSSNGLGF